MNGLTNDTIAIDANVFGHITTKDKCKRKYIGKLLRRLLEDNISLLVDDKKKIIAEYGNLFPRYLERADERGAEGELISYWFHSKNHKTVPVDTRDNLMVAITNIVPARKGKDRFYVYIAFKEGRVLVSNDGKDIWKRRGELKKKTNRFRTRGADILTSREACNKL